jgi:tetratricopeptide (TPR) repeat protein
MSFALGLQTSSAYAQIRISPNYEKNISKISILSTEEISQKLFSEVNEKEKSILWLALIEKGIQGDQSILLDEEINKFNQWLFKLESSEIIMKSLITLFHLARYQNYPEGLELTRKHLIANKDRLTKPDLFMATYLLAYDFASFLQFEKQNQLMLSQLDFINQYQPTNRNLILHLGAAYYGYGQVLVRKKRITDALEYFFKAENLYKEGPNSTHNLYTVYSYIADAFIKNKDYPRSDYYIRKAILEFPKDRKDARIQLQGIFAEAQLGLKDPETALAILKNADETIINPRDDYYLHFLEIYLDVLTQLKNYPKALSKGNQALFLAKKLNNQEIQSRLNYKMGLIHARTANYKTAEILIKGAILSLLEIHGFDDVDAYAALAELYTIEGRFKEALDAKNKQLKAEKHMHQLINHDILADLKSVSELRTAQAKKNRNSATSKSIRPNNSLNNENILSFFSNLFILLLIAVIIRVVIIFRNSSKE